jgi:hypothetical protein
MQVILFTDVSDTIGYGKYAGTYKIATEIRNSGYTCQVVDLFSHYSYVELEKIVSKFCSSETVLVGFSCSLMTKQEHGHYFTFGRPDQEFISIVEKIKSINNNIKVCLGGGTITADSYWQGVDYVVINKGDIAVIKLIKHLIDGDDIKVIKSSPCHVIDGNDYFYTQEQFAVSNIKYVPEDIIFPGESLPIEVARGCIFQCAFCNFDLIGKRAGDWQKAESALRDELIMNYEKFGTTHFMFTDELINESLSKVELIHSVFTKLPFKISYTSYARLDLIWKFPEMREMLLESGAKSLVLGIETLHEAAGKKIGKGLGEKRVKETLSYCAETWKGKIITSSNFIVGLPGEDESSVRNTVEYLVSDECPLDIITFIPLSIRQKHDGRSGISKIAKDPKKFGYTIKIGQSWQSNDMNFGQALDLVRDIYTDNRVLTKRKFPTSWIGRILNIGYTFEDIFEMINDETYSYENINKRLINESDSKKKWYFNQLMAL